MRAHLIHRKLVISGVGTHAADDDDGGLGHMCPTGWATCVPRVGTHAADDDDGGLGHMCPKGWDTCVPTPKKGPFSF